jgi:hypothetical protein
MAITVLRGGQIKDSTIQRIDLDTSTASQAVIAKIIQGTGITISSTGADSGTGDVTINTIAFEPALGNPGFNGSILSSSTAGTRAWVLPGEPALGDPATSGQWLTSTTGGTRSWKAFASLQTSPTSPAGTTSTTGVMAGLGGTITPSATGKILVTINGSMYNQTATGSTVSAIRYGTGTVPSNGAALTGTQIGGSVKRGAIAAFERMPFSVSAVITGLSLGTQVWLDLNQAAATAGTANLELVSIAAVELP